MYEKMKFHIEGIAPTMMHNGRGCDPLDPLSLAKGVFTSKRKKTVQDYEMIAHLEWLQSLYTREPGLVEIEAGKISTIGFEDIGWPGVNIEAMFSKAGKLRRLGEKVKRGIISDGFWKLDYQGPKDVNELWNDKRFRDNQPVKLPNKTRVIRCRPIFFPWMMDFEVSFLPDVLDKTEITEMVKDAGIYIGLGEYGPRYGRFELKNGKK